MIASANVPGERETLIEAFGDQRKTLLVTLDGVSETRSRATTTVSDLTLGGLVKYLTHCEKAWVRTIVEADPNSELRLEGNAVPSAYQLVDGDTFDYWVGAYTEQAQLTDEFIATVPDLDLLIPVPTAPWAPHRQHQTVRRILLHLYRETAQHSGHADLIRKALDRETATAGAADA